MSVGRIHAVANAALTPSEFESAITSITSAFGDGTRRQIYLLVREAEAGMTAAEVASAVDVHANVARHHLEKLAGGGYLRVEMGRPAGGAGRPSKRYQAAHEEIEIVFPVRRDDLLGTLLGRALARLPTEEATALAEEVGIDYGRALADAIEPGNAQRSLQSAVATVADALTSHGFAAHAEGRAGDLRIVSEHCPFGHAAVEHPVLCALDRGLVKGMLTGLYGDANPRLAGSVPMGDTVCTTTV
jgi:predicted ArsR family transcriptional regulator